MRLMTRTGWLLGMLVITAAWAAPKAAEVEPGSVVIVFKDGHQQSFRMADILRIEFGSPAERPSAIPRGSRSSSPASSTRRAPRTNAWPSRSRTPIWISSCASSAS